MERKLLVPQAHPDIGRNDPVQAWLNHDLEDYARTSLASASFDFFKTKA